MDANIYSQMKVSKPYKSYIKTILGKVYVKSLNSFSGEPDGVILSGDPKKKSDSCIIDVWSLQEDMYLHRANPKHFKDGALLEFIRENVEVSEEEKLNSMSDDAMVELLSSKFFTLQNVVNKFTSVAPVFRMLNIAKDLEKSDKIVKFIEGKLAELQLKEISTNE